MSPGRLERLLGLASGGLVTLALGFSLAGVGPIPTFAVAAASIVPLSHFMGLATEELGKHTGPAMGGLLNASLGNATELIIGILALLAGPQLYPVVKASITGSIVGNLLLVLGLSMLAGGFRFQRQTFSRHAASTRATMMAVAIVALAIPSLAFFSLQLRGSAASASASLAPLSDDIAVVLLLAYLLGLLFSLRTHRHLFNPVEDVEAREGPRWSIRQALLVLVAAAVLVGLASEVLVGALEPTIRGLGLNELFVGVIIVAVIGNAAEHSSAVLMAWRNRMELSVGIAASSSTQIALFVAPVLVLFSAALGRPLDLAFEIFELVAIIVAVAVANMVSSDGESNWYEGVLLVLVYAIVAIGFYFHPAAP